MTVTPGAGWRMSIDGVPTSQLSVDSICIIYFFSISIQMPLNALEAVACDKIQGSPITHFVFHFYILASEVVILM